mgnify:FL=1
MLYTSYYYCRFPSCQSELYTRAQSLGAAQILIYRDFITPRHNVQLPFPSIAICSNAARSCVHVLDTLCQRGKIEDSFWHAPLYVRSGPEMARALADPPPVNRAQPRA